MYICNWEKEMIQQGITGEGMIQIQTEGPTKRINGKDVLNSHFNHGAFINSYFQEVNGEKNNRN